MALFIASEVMFFVAFFWAFFDASLTPKLPIEEFSETFDSNGAIRYLASRRNNNF